MLENMFLSGQSGLQVSTDTILGFGTVGLVLLVFVAFLIIGYIVSWFLGKIIESVLLKMGLDKEVAKTVFHDSIGKLSPSKLLGSLLKWTLFVVFTQSLADSFYKGLMYDASNYLSYFPKFLLDAANYLPKILLAVIILIGGLIIADLAAYFLEHMKIRGIKVVSLVSKIFILFFFIMMALENLGIQGLESIQYTFFIVLAGFTLAFALAFGIGMGLAFKEEGKDVVKQLFHGKKPAKTKKKR